MNPAETPITENAHDIASLCVFGDMRDDGVHVWKIIGRFAQEF